MLSPLLSNKRNHKRNTKKEGKIRKQKTSTSFLFAASRSASTPLSFFCIAWASSSIRRTLPSKRSFSVPPCLFLFLCCGCCCLCCLGGGREKPRQKTRQKTRRKKQEKKKRKSVLLAPSELRHRARFPSPQSGAETLAFLPPSSAVGL